MKAHAQNNQPLGQWGVGPSLMNQSTINATTTSSVVYSANVFREFLLIQNQVGSTVSSTVKIRFNSSIVNASDTGVILSTGQIFNPSKPPVGSISIQSSGGLVPVMILEGLE